MLASSNHGASLNAQPSPHPAVVSGEVMAAARGPNEIGVAGELGDTAEDLSD